MNIQRTNVVDLAARRQLLIVSASPNALHTQLKLRLAQTVDSSV